MPVLHALLQGFSALSAAVHVELSDTAGKPFDLSGAGVAAPVWNSPARYETWAEGFRRAGFRVFRFPNGTLSNEYHWNGAGEFDSTGIWRASATEVKPGFATRSKWRGTTKDNYDARFPSHITDGDTSSLWWGETIQDTILPWVLMDVGTGAVFDSVEILWGSLKPDSVIVQNWTGKAYPIPCQADPASWRTILKARVDGRQTGAKTLAKGGRGVAIRPVHAPNGVQIREIRLYNQGKQVTSNIPDSRGQTKVFAISAHPGSIARDWIPDWTFDRFAEWLRKVPGAEALVCVNYGTGTPEEAAAWVRYANVRKKYGIRRWHVGNEMDGNWEEGGPVDPAQYAARFAEFAKAMKAVDPTIEVYGPGSYSTEFDVRRSGRPDGMSWMESFLWRMGRIEKASGMRLLDGVDFHSYPYWFEQGPARADSMTAAIGRFGATLDRLAAQMAKYLSDPGSRRISLSEFNTTVKITSLTLDVENGLGVASMLQDLWSRFPERAVSILWEPMASDPMNPDGSPIESYGALRLFTPAKGGVASDLKDPPTSTWWAQLMVREWMDGPGTRPFPVRTRGGSLRVAASGNATTRSIFAINASSLPETLSVHFPKAFAGAGEVLLWGPEHYLWTGRTSDAFAFPNLGPTSRTLAPAESLVVVPPRSMAIVRRGTQVKGAIRLLHAGWLPGRLQPTDTLAIFASAACSGRKLTSASWSLGKVRVDLPSFDGSWDGSWESVMARIPAASLPRGRGISLRLVFRAEGGDSLVVPVKLDNEDVPRAVEILDDFDAPGMPAKNGETWVSYGHGSNGSRMDITREDDGNGGHLLGTFHIVQPRTLSFPNFALAGLNLSANEFPDWNRYRGLVFDIRTRHYGASHRFLFQALTTSVKDYDDYQTELPDTRGSWTRIWLRWDELRQAGWGKDLGAFDPSLIRALQFRADGEGDGTIELENLAFWGTEGQPVPLVDPPRPTRGRSR